jgi:hypothetical protein
VISNFFFIDFLDEFGLFIEEKPIFTKKKFRRSAVCHDFMAVQMKILSARFLKDAFSFGSLKEMVKVGLVFIFDLKNKFRLIRIFGYFSLPYETFTNFYVFGLDLM